MRTVWGRATVADVDAFVSRLAAIGDEHGAAVQAFDARLVADEAHLRAAVEGANRAFERGESVARDRAVEMLCYAAGMRQIDRALAMGVDAGTGPVAVVVDGGDEAAAVAAVVDELDATGERGDPDEAAISEFFGIGDAERAATGASLSALVRERVALLDVEK